MKNGLSGLAAMHPWSGYSYGAADEPFDDRLLWASTIASGKYMNSSKVTSALNHWNGYWVQGRQAQKIFNSNDDDGVPKEIQYYIAESKEFVTGYVRNRSYNIWTNRLENTCSNLSDSVGFGSHLDNFYIFDWQTGPHNLFVYPLEKKTYYTIRWYDFLTGTEFLNQTYQSKGDGRFRLEYPTLHPLTRPILWFSMEKASDNRFVEESNEIEPQFGGNSLTIYPNPFSNEFFVNSVQTDVLEIFSALGIMVARIEIEKGRSTIQLNNVEKGIYFIHSKNTSEVIKILKL